MKLTNSEYRPRAADLDMNLGILEKGPQNSITDVSGVRVGHKTIISGEGQLRSGQGPVRTGITTILPHSGNLFRENIFVSSKFILSLSSFGICVRFDASE